MCKRFVPKSETLKGFCSRVFLKTNVLVDTLVVQDGKGVELGAQGVSSIKRALVSELSTAQTNKLK